MSFDIDTRDLDAARRALGAFDELVDRAAEPLVDDVGGVALDLVRSRAARHTRTGRMLRQVRLSHDGAGIKREASVRAGGPMASLVVTGSSAHDIRPVRAHALALHGAARHPFAARVRHPGTRSDPFVVAAFDETVGQSVDDMSRTADRLADQLADSMTRR